MKDTLNNRNAIIIWHHLKENPETGYEDLGKLIKLPGDKPNYVNSLVKKLQRGGYLEIIRRRDSGGKMTVSYKRCLKEPKIR